MNGQSGETPVLILLVDADPVSGRAIRQALEAGGVRSHLHIVGGEVEAISYLRHEAEYRDAARPDFLLFQPKLPRGVEPAVTRRLESRDRLRALTSELRQCKEPERRRIAGYRHDPIDQALAVSRMAFDGVVRSDDLEKKAQAIEQIRHLLDETTTYIQTLTYDPSRPVFSEFGLGAALEWLGEKVSDEHGLAFELTLEGAPLPLSEDKAALLFGVTRELLMNVVKHAHAAQVRTGLRWSEDSVEIEIKDDGTGFDPSLLEARGENMTFGLLSVRDRIESLGGRVEIESVPSHGTRVSLILPLGGGASQPNLKLVE